MSKATGREAVTRAAVGREAVTRADAERAARLRLVVSRLSRAIRQHGAAGLTPSQLSALATIEELGPMRTSELANQEVVGAPFATRVVASLEDLGFVDRIDDPSDGRACLIGITSAGRTMLEGLWIERTAGLNGRISSLSAEQLALLEQALPVLELLAREGSAVIGGTRAG